MADVDTNNATLRAFSQFLANVEGGNLHGDLSRELQDLIAGMQDASGGHDETKGKITIVFDFKFDPKSGLFNIGGDYKVAGPKERRGRSVLWATAENFLTPYNPRQKDMFVRDVNKTGDVRSV